MHTRTGTPEVYFGGAVFGFGVSQGGVQDNFGGAVFGFRVKSLVLFGSFCGFYYFCDSFWEILFGQFLISSRF